MCVDRHRHGLPLRARCLLWGHAASTLQDCGGPLTHQHMSDLQLLDLLQRRLPADEQPWQSRWGSKSSRIEVHAKLQP